MAVGKLDIGKLNITFVFRHRFEKSKDDDILITYWIGHEFREWEIGFWFRREKIVSRKEHRDLRKWKNYLVNSFTLGVNLLICKAWISWNINGLEIKE
jgi:hypothetical protein